MARDVLPLETALRIGMAAVSSLHVKLRYKSSSRPASHVMSMQSVFSWIEIHVHPTELQDRRDQVIRSTRESIEILSALACCYEYGLHENIGFWMAVWKIGSLDSQQTADGQQDPISSIVMNAKRIIAPADDHCFPRFLFKASWAPGNLLAFVNDLLCVNSVTISKDYQMTMELLHRHMDPSRHYRTINCGVEVRFMASEDSQSALPLSVGKLLEYADKRVINDSMCISCWMSPISISSIFVSVKNGSRTEVSRDYFNRTAELLHACSFRIEKLRLDFVALSHAKYPPMSFLVGYRRPPTVHIKSFRLMLWTLLENEKQAIGRATTDAAASSNNYQRCSPVVMERLELEADSALMACFGALCCILPSFTGLRELKIITRRWSFIPWNWLALALFHPESTSTLQSLQMPLVALTMRDIDAIREILHTPWRSAMRLLLSQLQEFSVNDESIYKSFNPDTALRAIVRKGTAIAATPGFSLLTKPFLILDHDQTFIVLDIVPGWLSDWICIFIPAFGCGFVPRHAAITLYETQVTPRIHSSITSLNMHFDEIPTAIALLELVGASLESLDVTFHTIVSNHDIKCILQLCPKLRLLRFRVARLEAFSSLIDALPHKKCEITSLEINALEFSFGCVEYLARKLSDPSFSLSSNLRELSICGGEFTENDLESLLSMLRVNRTLSLFHVSLPEELTETYLPRFSAHRADPVLGTLPLRTKLAFLSIISHRSCITNDTPWQRMEKDVVRSIFEFAGHQRRQVTITRSDWRSWLSRGIAGLL